MAAVIVTLTPALMRLFPGCKPQLAIEAACVADVIAALDARWPGMGDRLCDSTPGIRRHINVFVDGARSTLATPLADGAAILIITAITGG